MYPQQWCEKMFPQVGPLHIHFRNPDQKWKSDLLPFPVPASSWCLTAVFRALEETIDEEPNIKRFNEMWQLLLYLVWEDLPQFAIVKETIQQLSKVEVTLTWTPGRKVLYGYTYQAPLPYSDTRYKIQDMVSRTLHRFDKSWKRGCNSNQNWFEWRFTETPSLAQIRTMSAKFLQSLETTLGHPPHSVVRDFAPIGGKKRKRSNS